MNSKNLLSGRERELMELAEQFEKAKAEGRSVYMDADDLADLADWYAIRRKYDLAKEVTEYGLSLHPANTALLVEQAYLYLDTLNKAKAREIVSQIHEDTAEVTILRAQLLLEEGQLAEAQSLLDTIENKSDLSNIIETAYMYIDMGYPDHAKTWLEYGKGKYDEEEPFLAVSADCLYAQREYEQAMVYYNKLIDKNPYSAPYWLGLGRCHFELGQLDKAIEACDYAIVSEENFADAHLIKGQAFYDLGNMEKAFESYRQAERLGAVSADYISLLEGTDCMVRKEWEQACVHLRKAALTVSKDDPVSLVPLYANLAYCLDRIGDEEAAQYWDMAYQITPEDYTLYLLQGRSCMEKDDPKGGIACWNKALKLAPCAETWHEIGWECLEIAQLEIARIAFEHVKEMNPDYENINEELALLSMMLHDKESFYRYNSQCKYPFELDKLEALSAKLREESRDNIADAIKSILDSLL